MLTEMSSNFALGSSAKKTSFLGCKTFQLMHISGSLVIKIAILWGLPKDFFFPKKKPKISSRIITWGKGVNYFANYMKN